MITYFSCLALVASRQQALGQMANVCGKDKENCRDHALIATVCIQFGVFGNVSGTDCDSTVTMCELDVNAVERGVIDVIDA
jgi:hypothetical protein